MPEQFTRERRYLVLKLSDLRKYVSPNYLQQLMELEQTINAARGGEGRPPLECAVVESDWPEYEPTWKAIERRVRLEHCEHRWLLSPEADAGYWCANCGAWRDHDDKEG